MTALDRPATLPAEPSDRRRIPGEEGIWVFVLGDMTVFALFFATFMYSRGRNPATFATAHTDLSVLLGTINTVLLLTSSLLVALGVNGVLSRDHHRAPRWFGAALACGGGFVTVKSLEWTHLFLAGRSAGSSEYFSYYFMFTGIHLGHVVIGLVVLSRLIAVTRTQKLTESRRRLCETGGIFWHMVDLLWVVLFALFYLVR
jgi:nitric oxide reductase NorE protein